MQQQMGQQGIYKEYDAYEPGAVYQTAQDEGNYHGHMTHGFSSYYN